MTFDEPKPEPTTSSRGLMNVLIIAILLAGAAGIYYYTYTFRPEVIEQLKLKLDRFGMSSDSPAEIQRQNEIKKLSISYEEKQILLNRTIFMGASPRMVILALGKPKEGHKVTATAGTKESVILVYHLPKEMRPTMLRFEDNKLVEAKKGSSIDFDTTPIPYTGINSE